ncbi:hypothetical protein [Parasphingorhabdus sp.]|uniref:hypothetical protein n=1 Tax=Parasphingorhabdus sp. TaxID=2709688 RepID=UPI0032655C0B
MTAQIKSEWIWLASIAVSMIVVPWWLLTGEPDHISEPQPLLITQVQIQEIGAVDTFLAKPIFNAERAPLAFADEVIGQEPQEIEIAQPVSPIPTLVGLVSKRRGKAVAIVKTHDGETKTLSAGDSSDGWRLIKVGKNDATFANAGQQRTIDLYYGNKAIGGPSNSPVAVSNIQDNFISDGEPN